MRIEHSLLVPNPRRALVEQFFDFEHVPWVHPRTLGRVEVRALGRRWLVADLFLPVLSRVRVRIRFRQDFRPPDRIDVVVLGGLGRGTRYEAVLTTVGYGTQVDERLLVPGLLGMASSLARGWIRARMRAVWEEDLRTKMCRGGWPGLAAVGIRESEIG